VSNEHLVEPAVSREDIGSGEVDVILKAKQEVEVAEAGVGVGGDNREREVREGGSEVGGCGGLANAAFLGGGDHHIRGWARELRRCAKNFFKIFCHIEFYDTCMKYLI